ncbi:GLPGLI family protein [Gaetbulibacter aestuarii]|uniref:GLPGLI family protein n=1 Tax=Gaetbulibacter aestuarii TaxID=1502358 RepID=A0ABW7N0A6_9FLAO
MKLKKTSSIALIFFLIMGSQSINGQTAFQGKAYYNSKTTMDFSRFRGRQLTEQQKKEMQERMKSFLEKTFILNFNAEASLFKEEEKLAAPTAGGGGRGFGFMNSFSSGPIYKNIKTKTFVQDQEFFGKQFLIKESLTNYKWIMGKDMRKIGEYTAFKATTTIPASELNWTRPQPPQDQNSENDTTEVAEDMVTVTAWYTPQIPVSQGPGEFWGLPGLILELNTGETVMLCSKIVLNPAVKEDIKMPDNGKEVTKNEYSTIITEKITEMRENRMRRDPRRR